MKIVHICLCGLFTDGFNYQDNLITKYHRQMGFDVTVIASQWVWDEGSAKQVQVDPYVNEDGVKVIRIPNRIGNVNSKLKLYKGLYCVIDGEKPDVIFLHNFQFLDALTVRKYVKQHRVKWYVDNHSDYSNSATNWLSKTLMHKLLWRFVAARIQPYVTRFYGVLPARVDFLKDVYKLPAEKCELLEMGADDELVDQAARPDAIRALRERYGISENDFFIVTGGKIDRFKMQTLLLMQAVKELADTLPVKLLVFGSIDDSLKSQADALVDGNAVQYIGWIRATDSYDYFAAADLVVFPGRHSVFWEQVVAQGIPMICKQWSGTTHVDIGGNVLFLQEDSKEEIAGVLFDLLASPQRYAQMKAAAKQDANRFLYSDIAKRAILP
ncbi:MAG: glycosyltransferase family 4 protein [Anaerotruncus rubiinfantis]|jgi:1,2-diacylglycerol 3-alpha-glucosyltransferase